MKEKVLEKCLKVAAIEEAKMKRSLSLGAAHAGIGCISLNKVLSTMNIPYVDDKTFKRYERKVGPVIEETPKKSYLKKLSRKYTDPSEITLRTTELPTPKIWMNSQRYRFLRHGLVETCAKILELNVGAALVNKSKALQESGIEVRIVVGDEDATTQKEIKAVSSQKIFKLPDYNHTNKIQKVLYKIKDKFKQMKKSCY
ncbi:hypothetical protein JTB14_001239 [Gonioctena quinquepunctata]|nr:hypothetical protein JTB14_001239 [Gonioctena quinquepunctata]